MKNWLIRLLGGATQDDVARSRSYARGLEDALVEAGVATLITQDAHAQEFSGHIVVRGDYIVISGCVIRGTLFTQSTHLMILSNMFRSVK